MENGLSKKELIEILRERLCQIQIYFNLVDFYDKAILERECSKESLKISFLDKIGLNGCIGASLNVIPLEIPSLDWFETEIRTRFKRALIKTMKATDNKKKIEEHLKQSNFVDNFCHLISLINSRVRQGKEDINRLRKSMQKYKITIGEDGIELFLKIFKEKKTKNILKQYSSYNEFLLKKYQIELFISQQINQIYLTIIAINSEMIKESQKLYSLTVNGLENYNFELIEWHNPFLHKRSELYKCRNPEHIILYPMHEQINQANESLIGLRLTVNNLCSGIHIIRDVLKQEEKYSKESHEDLPQLLGSIKDNLQMADSKEIEEIQNIILAHQDTQRAMLSDFYRPVKKDFERYLLKKRRMDNLLEDQITKVPMRAKGETIGVVKLSLPDNFGMVLPSKEIQTVHALLVSQETRINDVINEFSKLLEQLEDLKHVKKMKEHELSEAQHREMMQKELRILSAINKTLEIINKLFDIISKGKP